MAPAVQSPIWPALPDHAAAALSVCFAGGPKTFPDLLKRVVEHSDDRIVGVIVFQAKAHPGPIVFIILLDESLVRIRGERKIVDALWRACDVHVLAVCRMVVVINPPRADAMDTEAIEVLTAGKSDPNGCELVIVHLDKINQAKTFLQ